MGRGRWLCFGIGRTIAMQVLQEPAFGLAPISLDGARGRLHGLGGFSYGETREESTLNDLNQASFSFAQGCESSVDSVLRNHRWRPAVACLMRWKIHTSKD